jgi:hypothetical protein
MAVRLARHLDKLLELLPLLYPLFPLVLLHLVKVKGRIQVEEEPKELKILNLL